MTKLEELPSPIKLLAVHAQGTVSAEHITVVMTKYAEYLTSGNAEAIASMYAPDAVLHDPAPAPPIVGRDHIRAFYQSVFGERGGSVDMRLDGKVRVSGNMGAAPYVAVMAVNGVNIRLELIDLMTFDDDGLVTSMKAYWCASNATKSEAPPRRKG